MQNEIKIFVICTVYDHENYIRAALESFVIQKTDFAFEVLVHDKVSTDKTAYEAMSKSRNPYGDEFACKRIADIFAN